jgi:hypothetical protein
MKMSILKKVMKQIFQTEKSEDRHIFDLWNEVSAFAVMGLPVSISKNTVERNEAGSPQRSGLFRRSIGSPKGQIKDWRSAVPDSYRGVHAVEFSDRYEVHVDRFDPSVKPLEHLIFDNGKQLATMLSVYAIARFLDRPRP